MAARDKSLLHSLGITHIVNAAHVPCKLTPGPCFHVNTGPRFYRDMTVDYYGVEADDAVEFILSPFFYPTARYIRAALSTGGKSNLETVWHINMHVVSKQLHQKLCCKHLFYYFYQLKLKKQNIKSS